MDRFSQTLSGIRPIDAGLLGPVRERLDRLTKPRGSLGRLEEVAARYMAITGKAKPEVGRKVIVTFAADHGVVEECVSAYPREVTAQMVGNFLRGGAAVNVLARHVGAEVVVVDVGVDADLPPADALWSRKVRRGTSNFARGPAMSLEETLRAIEVGIELAETHALRGVGLLGAGEMGIGNSTAAAAVTACLTGLPAAKVTGRGTGIDDAALARKIGVIERALAVNAPDPDDPVGVLSKVGGLELAGIAGLVLGGAAARVPVVVDGFIAGAAALAACRLAPAADYLFMAHRSWEVGHEAVLQHLGHEPLLDLQMRLGEGTGAALAMCIIEAAVKTLAEMATFEEAGVAEG